MCKTERSVAWKYFVSNWRLLSRLVKYLQRINREYMLKTINSLWHHETSLGHTNFAIKACVNEEMFYHGNQYIEKEHSYCLTRPVVNIALNKTYISRLRHNCVTILFDLGFSSIMAKAQLGIITRKKRTVGSLTLDILAKMLQSLTVVVDIATWQSTVFFL